MRFDLAIRIHLIVVIVLNHIPNGFGARQDLLTAYVGSSGIGSVRSAQPNSLTLSISIGSTLSQ